MLATWKLKQTKSQERVRRNRKVAPPCMWMILEPFCARKKTFLPFCMDVFAPSRESAVSYSQHCYQMVGVLKGNSLSVGGADGKSN